MNIDVFPFVEKVDFHCHVSYTGGYFEVEQKKPSQIWHLQVYRSKKFKPISDRVGNSEASLQQTARFFACCGFAWHP